MKRLLLIALIFSLCINYLYSQSLNIRWKVKTNASIFASPLEKNGIVYFGSLDSVFRAIDVKNGKEVWQFKAEHEIRSTACFYLSFR